MVFRPGLRARQNVSNKVAKRNITRSQSYPRVKWSALRFSPCAVVGGGFSTQDSLEILRKWEGDIYAINDTAGYLSDNGIPCYALGLDCTEVPYKTGKLVKGAVFATRTNLIQFQPYPKDKVHLFPLLEDRHDGIEGGPTMACRAPLLFLQMGYRGVHFFGMDGCFYDDSHVSGHQDVAQTDMIIIRSGNMHYLTNASLMMQSQFLSEKIVAYPKFLINESEGLLKAMIDDPDGWTVAAVAKDLAAKYESGGQKIFNWEYSTEGKQIWLPQQLRSSPPLLLKSA